MFKKKILAAFLCLFVAGSLSAKPAAKYVFYFIADGVGLNAFEMTDQYRRAVYGDSLVITSLPVRTHMVNYMANAVVSDSAAGGTALAIGYQSRSYYIGVDAQDRPHDSILKVAHDNGYATGCITTVGINHATPATFYAHNTSRFDFEGIAMELINSDFIDFAAGGGVLATAYDADSTRKSAPRFRALFHEKGWTTTGDPKVAASTTTSSVFFHYKDGTRSDVPYAIDAEPGNVNLVTFMEAAIDNLSARKNGKFIIMCEGGKCDYAAHANDAGTYVAENYNLDQCVRLAYEFYLKHPKETLIIVTSDHETGGVIYGHSGKPKYNIANLKYQTKSKSDMTDEVRDLREACAPQVPTYEQVRAIVDEGYSFGNGIDLTADDEAKLKVCYDKYFTSGEEVASLYERNDKIVDEASQIVARKANIIWAESGHTASYIPFFSVGVGSETFMGLHWNWEIPRQMSKIMKIDKDFINK